MVVYDLKSVVNHDNIIEITGFDSFEVLFHGRFEDLPKALLMKKICTLNISYDLEFLVSI